MVTCTHKMICYLKASLQGAACASSLTVSLCEKPLSIPTVISGIRNIAVPQMSRNFLEEIRLPVLREMC